MMVLSSIAPLLLLWMIRGIPLVPDIWLVLTCLLAIVLPNGALWIRVWTAKKNVDKREVTVGYAEDNRDHILVYLFSMLLPLYGLPVEEWRDLGALLAAVAFIIFLFYHLNLHYVNILFALCGYNVFTINPLNDGNPYSGRNNVVLITRRTMLNQGEQVTAYRLSDTVYIEIKRNDEH